MNDRGWILSGLLAFWILFTFPAWHRLIAGKPATAPGLTLPGPGKECVAPVSYMKTSHMLLLRDWRDRAVRDNIRTYFYNGKTYAISLTGTCLQQCHADKAGFCDRCHTYNGVHDPACWDCHVDPRPLPAGVQRTASTEPGGRNGH